MKIRWGDDEWYPVLGVDEDPDPDDPDADGVMADVPAYLVVAYREAVAAMLHAQAELSKALGRTSPPPF